MFWRRLRKVLGRTLFWPAEAERDLDDEIRHHLAEEARSASERGLSDADAAAAARRAFGNVVLAKERTRAVWVSTRIEQLRQDLRFGARILTKSPGVSATAVVLIALVIGGNTTVFSIAHGILTKPASGVHASGLFTFSWVNDEGDVETHTPYRVYAHFVEHSRTLQSIAAVDFQRVTLTHPNGSYAVRVSIVSPNYFETLGARLAAGRSFTAAEASGGASGLVVVVADHLAQHALGGINKVVGEAVALNGQPATIVGVADPAFRGAWLAEMTDVWVPLVGEFREWLQPDRAAVDVAMIGRGAEGVSPAEAQAELATLWMAMQRRDPGLNQKVKVHLVPYSSTGGGNSIIATQGSRMLAIFSVVTLLTIAIVCANVANLLIARAVVRQREVALRQSLGASRVRIVRSLLAEGLTLSLAAWAAACLIAWFVAKAVLAWLLASAPRSMTMPDLSPDWTVVGYALVLAILCTVAVTLGPALVTWRQQLLPFLKVGEQGVVRARSRLSRSLVVLQLAFSVVLLTSAGLAHRSLSLAESLDLGFDTRNLLLVTVNTAGSADGPQANAVLLDLLKTRLGGLPGVDGVSHVPGQRGRLSDRVDFPVRRDQGAAPTFAVDNHVGPGYFSVIGVPFVGGGDLARDDRRTGPGVIVSRSLAETLWPGDSAVGKTVLTGSPERTVEAEVVGVVRDAFFSGRGTRARSRYIFFAANERPSPPGETTFYVRHSASRQAIARAVARTLRETDPRVAIAGIRSLDDEVAADAAPVWMLTRLLTLFAAGSLLIAAIGQYAVVTFDGRRRSREFGLRIALGASSQQLLASVMAESFRLTTLGLAVGFALSVGVAMVLVRILYGVTPTDAPTYVGVFLLLGAASLLACYLPARRASRTDPMLVLRTE